MSCLPDLSQTEGNFCVWSASPYVPSSFYFTKVTALVFNAPAGFLWVRTCNKDWDASGWGGKWRTQGCMREREAKSEQGRKQVTGRVNTMEHMDLGHQLLAYRVCWGLFLSKSEEAVLLHAPNQLSRLRTTPRDINSPAIPHCHVMAKEDAGCPGNSCKDMRCQSGELWGQYMQRKTIHRCEQALCISSATKRMSPAGLLLLLTQHGGQDFHLDYIHCSYVFQIELYFALFIHLISSIIKILESSWVY